MRKLAASTMIILYLMIGFTGKVLASHPQTDEAFRLYNEQQFEAAASIYKALIDSGHVSDDMHYNLGNCYYKLEAFPSAILHYEKALKWNPHNEDARHNLELAYELHTDKIEAVPVIFLKKWDRALIRFFPRGGWTVVTMIFFAFLLASIAGFVLNKRRRRLFLILLVVNLATTTLSAVYANKEYTAQTQTQAGIVFTPTLNVKSSPDKASATLFVIHEGTKVFLLDKVGEWHLVQIADGSRGWIMDEDMVLI